MKKLTKKATAELREAISQSAYDTYRDGKHKHRRDVAEIGDAELADFAVLVAAEPAPIEPQE